MAQTVTEPRAGVPRSRFKIPHFRWAVLGTNASVLILNYGDRAAVGVAAPLIIAEFGFSKGTMGLILSAFALTYAPAAFLGGWAADKYGPRKTMTVAVAWWSLFTAATALCFNFASFIVQRLMFGLGEGPQGSTTARTMANWFPQREYATAVGLSFAFNPLGAAIGIPVVTWMLVLFNDEWRWPFVVLGVVGVLIALLWYAVVRDRPEQHPLVTDAELRHITTGPLSRAETESADEAVPTLRQYIRHRSVWSNALAFFGFSWILFMFLSWYPVFLVEKHGVDLEDLAWAGAIPWIAGAVGTALGGVLSDYLVRRTNSPFATRKWIAVVCLAAAALLLVPIAVVSSTGGAVALLTVALLLLYLSNVQFFALVAAAVHASRLGSVTGFVHFCANCAAIIAPTVTGFLVQGVGSWGLAFGVAAALALIGAVTLAFARPRTAASGPDAVIAHQPLALDAD
jgi:ACS family hexuronate transporter-like MFS transporter